MTQVRQRTVGEGRNGQLGRPDPQQVRLFPLMRRCALQPEGFQHLSQPNSAEVSSVTGSHASTHAIAMIALRGNERPTRVSTNPAA